jgi:hypothetical protein
LIGRIFFGDSKFVINRKKRIIFNVIGHGKVCPKILYVGRLVVVIDVNPSHGFWTRRLMKLFGHEGK